MATYFWVGGTGTWSEVGNTQFAITSGGVATILNPTSADTVIFDSLSGAGTCTTASGSVCRAATLNTSTLELMLGANHTMTGIFNLTSGTLNLSSHTLTIGNFTSINTNTRAVKFETGKIVLTGTGSLWGLNTATNCTFTGTKNVEITNSGAVACGINNGGTAGGSESLAINFSVTAGSYTFTIGNNSAIGNLNFTGFTGNCPATARAVYGNLTYVSGMTITASSVAATTFAATSGTKQITTGGLTLDFPIIFNGVGGTFAFQDALTQGSTRAFTITNGTVQLKAAATSTVGSFVANNSSVKFLQSTIPGSQATLSQASGTVNVADLTIRDINAVGGAAWNAYTDFENTDAGNNDGWNFSISPPYATYEPPIIIRSFTQPRRF
jgi:hypothetical protein